MPTDLLGYEYCVTNENSHRPSFAELSHTTAFATRPARQFQADKALPVHINTFYSHSRPMEVGQALDQWESCRCHASHLGKHLLTLHGRAQSTHDRRRSPWHVSLRG
jgi:hypothetical protein